MAFDTCDTCTPAVFTLVNKLAPSNEINLQCLEHTLWGNTIWKNAI